MKLNGKEKFSYGLGAVGKDMVYMLSASYVLYYYQDILGVSAVAMGVILLVARIFDAFNDPFMPTVATGIPGGICTIASKASIPSSEALIGTPITGRVVMDAITPQRCAAIPAAAIITLIPRPLAFLAKTSTSAGVR